jgi:S-(hydroxymethyl)glutathione dehydrogenase/alcohol dehydrogenase
METVAAVLKEIGRPLSIETVSVPKLKDGQVLVDVAYSGVCRSQLNEIRGLKGEDKYLPHTLGHEGSGIVRAVGHGITKVKSGDHVVLTWIKGIGADVPSTQYTGCDGKNINSGAVSTLMTSTVASENRIVKIPDKMPLREAALLGCAIPTGAGVVLNTAKVSPGSSVAIFGVGGIGLSALLAAELAGAATIIAIDIHERKLRQAVTLGATHTINARTEEVLSAIGSITNGKGIDYAIESAGTAQSMENAFRAVRDNGGLCVLCGNLAAGERISIDPFDLIKGKKIVGTWGGETQPELDIPRYAELYLSGKFNMHKLITHEYSLQNVNEAFDVLDNGGGGRILVSMTAESN